MPINRIRAMLSVYGRHIEICAIIVALALIGGIAGYTIARVESNQALLDQANRHSAEMTAQRDERTHENREMRGLVSESLVAAVRAATSSGEAAKQLKAMADELGPEQTRAARRAADASKRAIDASNTAQEAAKSALQSERQAGRILAPGEAYRRQEDK